MSTETAQFELGGMVLFLLLSFPKQKYPKSELKHTFPDTPESPITGGGPIGRGALLAPYTLGKERSAMFFLHTAGNHVFFTAPLLSRFPTKPCNRGAGFGEASPLGPRE